AVREVVVVLGLPRLAEVRARLDVDERTAARQHALLQKAVAADVEQQVAVARHDVHVAGLLRIERALLEVGDLVAELAQPDQVLQVNREIAPAGAPEHVSTDHDRGHAHETPGAPKSWRDGRYGA